MANLYSNAAHSDVAARVMLERFCADLGLHRKEVRRRQPDAWVQWEIAAQGYADAGAGSGIVIADCKKYTDAGLPQAIYVSLAYLIQDAGPQGGYIASPLDLHEGMKKVSAKNVIVHMRLDPDTTVVEFGQQFMNKMFLKMRESTHKTSGTGTSIHH
jgi:hypothetical protein